MLDDTTVVTTEPSAAARVAAVSQDPLPRRIEPLAEPIPVAISRRRPPRRVVVLAIAGLVAGIAVTMTHRYVVGGLVHANRQRHLAADFRTGRPAVGDGEAIGVIQIPKVGISEVVVAGEGTDNLRSGPALRTDGPVPGVPGVSMIVGHRRDYGGPFDRIPELVAGDSIVVQARNLKPVDYRVVAVRSMTTDPRETPALLGPLTAPATSRLLLVTGTGAWFDRGVFVVVADATVPGDEAPERLEPRIAPRGSSVIGPVLLGGVLAALAAVLCAIGLGGHRSRWPRIVCLIPVVSLSVILGLMTLEQAFAPLK